jgi:hypothetical protein
MNLLAPFILNFFCSAKASNLGTFLLGAMSVFAYFSYTKSIKEKNLEKRSDIAEKLLNLIDEYILEIESWLDNVNSTYSYEEPENIKLYNTLSDVQKKEFLSNQYEKRNCSKQIPFIIKKLSYSENLSYRLASTDLTTTLKKLIAETKKLQGQLHSYHFEPPKCPLRAQALKDLELTKKNILSLHATIRDQVLPYLFHKK